MQPNSSSKIKEVLGASGVPLGLGYLGAVLQKEGHQVRIIDGFTLDYSLKQFQAEIESFDPQLVGITSTTPAIPQSYKLSKRVKKIDPEMVTMIGGPHVTFTPQQTLKECPSLDIVVRGEGEETIKELATALDQGDSWDPIQGITFRKDHHLKSNPSRPFIEDLDQLPYPAYHLLPMEQYEREGRQYGMVMTSRGCPFNCSFCSSSKLFVKHWRARSSLNVVGELEMLKKDFGIKEVGFMDDTFTLNANRAKKICDLMIQKDLNLDWTCSSRVDTLDESLLRKLKQAGCHTIYLGLESGTQETLDRIGKGTTLNQGKKAVDLARKVGIEVLRSFILGIPGESLSHIKKNHCLGQIP